MKLIGKYTGNELAGKSIKIESAGFSIKLVSNAETTFYGYSFDSIKAYNHSWETVFVNPASTSEDGSIEQQCSVCKEFRSVPIYAAKTISLSATKYVYNGAKRVPSIVVKDRLGNIINKSNYNIVSSNSVYVGKYSIKADLFGNYSGVLSATYNIVPKLNFSSFSIYIGGTKQITPSGSKKAYTYKSSNTKIATVSSKGLLKGVSAGTVTVTVSSNGVSSTCTLRVVKPSVSLNKTSIALYTRGAYALKATSAPKATVKWSSNNTKIAKVSSKGTVTAVRSGSCTITARIVCYGKTYTKTCKVTVVTPSVKLNKSSASIYQKESVQLSATVRPAGSKVTWISSNKSVASVSSSGKVTGVKKGTATITAKISYKGKTYSKSCRINVVAPKLTISKTSVKLCNSQYTNLSVKGGNGAVTWKSNNTKVARVDKNGRVTGYRNGSCTIYATKNGVTVKCAVTVYLCNYENTSIPDFGAYVGAMRYDFVYDTDDYGDDYVMISYNKAEAKKLNSNWYNGYCAKLKSLGYSRYSSENVDGSHLELWMSKYNALVFGYDSKYVYTMIYY